MSFIQEIETRRSIYALGKTTELSNGELETLIKKAVRLSPSAFNSQSSRAVVLFDASHLKFWEIVKETLRKMIPEDKFESTAQRMDSFAAGKGTVLFYEDQDVVKGLQEQFATYAENFPIWSEHSTAIAQFAVWTALSEQKVGASLQHYNPIADEEVAKLFDIPASWKLRAQLVFGSIEADAQSKEFMEDESRFKVFA
ncbi:nitroreductase family protein [Acinetobacter sp. B5B]|uniref:nitroreductase family protein n=1 Tax=Acinetobacter baretiae TaxID=2605383 RepID=UPI0018C3084D|nr:nitroreductase family protein [Acinetobacter baretiae]MBF7681984.1 nitroreductase family protein [Acinetobacter baretiae]MBF7684222.1 nitroreductase family protein [Acinetobacter baretiae]